MLHDNEVVMAAFGIVVLLWLIANRRQLASLPHHEVTIVAYCLLVLAWLSTVIEEFCWPNGFNLIEHLSYAFSALLMTYWTYLLAFHEKSASHDGH